MPGAFTGLARKAFRPAMEFEEVPGGALGTCFIDQLDAGKELGCISVRIGIRAVVEHPPRALTGNPATTEVIEEGDALVVEGEAKEGGLPPPEGALARLRAIDPDRPVPLTGHGTARVRRLPCPSLSRARRSRGGPG